MTILINRLGRLSQYWRSTISTKKGRLAAILSLLLIFILLPALLWIQTVRKRESKTSPANVSDQTELADLEVMIKKEPNNVEVLKYLGKSYYAAFKYDRAIETLNKAVGLDPANGQSYSTLASVYRDKGESSPNPAERAVLIIKARLTFEQALKADRSYVRAYLDYADLLHSENDDAGAIAILNRGLAANPNNDRLVKLKGVLEQQ